MKGSHFLAFLGGAVTATAIALLYLTDEGANLREKIKQRLENNGIKLSEEELEKLIEKVKSELDVNQKNVNDKTTEK